MKLKSRKVLALLAALALTSSPNALAAPAETSVMVVVGPNAPELEQFAAQELCKYLSKLFGLDVSPASSITRSASAIFLIGAPATNSLISNTEFPSASEQGIVLKSVTGDRGPAMIVGGGSPKATLWAVYHLVERWGVTYLLRGDVLPAPRSFEMPRLDVVEEPNLPVRQWRVLNEHAMGPISWGLADYKPLLDQLAKLRFNRLLLYIWPGQPFLPLEHKGIKQTSGTLFFGHRYPISDDMIGRSLFGNEKEFWNPDLPLPGGEAQAMTDAALRHAQGLIEYAKGRGMECVMSATLTEFPREFRPLLEHTNPVEMTGTPTIGPGPDTDMDDPAVRDLARAVLETTIKTYPGAEYIALDMPEWRAWVNQYERAWKALDAKYDLSGIRSLDDVLKSAQNRKDYSGGPERAVSEVKADIVALHFYDSLISEPQFKSSRKKWVMSSVAEELFPILARVLPEGSETLNFVDYTPSRIVKRRDVLKDIPAREISSSLIFTLHDDNVGVLPQLATHSLAELTRDIRSEGWAGFSTRYWLSGDHDPCVAYLARAAWDVKVTPQAIYREQIARVCGDATVDDMMEVFREVEAATETLEWHGLGLTFTVPGMMMKHWTTGGMSAELKTVAPRYQAALEAATRAGGKMSPSGKGYIDYWVGRLTFGIDYMHAIEAVRAAATAEAANNVTGALHEGERALDLVTNALRAYARVARDRSDKGAIAVMNEYVLRPLRAKVALLNQSAPAPQPAVQAASFQSTKIYQSKQRPSYTSWVSFFPGIKPGEWYINCAEITTPETPPIRASAQWVYEMSLPRGYDTSKYFQEHVLLKSTDAMKSWNVIARNPVIANGGSFGQARTPDGHIHGFVWAAYSRDPATKTNDIYQISRDEGQTWTKPPSFVSDRFVWYPHRLRTLRDGTLVLCAPRAAKWGRRTDYPMRAAVKLDVVSDMEMMLFFSHDQGATWSNPLPILSGQTVSETDFVELPDGNLLFVNNSIFATPGRQFVVREGARFTPGPLERVQSGTVPETICLIDDSVLIGCHRPGAYHWSNDLGQNWQPLDGAPSSIEVYQPWMHHLGSGRVACAGHYGADDPIGGRDQSINLHTFSVDVRQKTRTAKLWIERAFDEATKSFLNTYTISLTADEKPLADRDVEVWYVARDKPGYDSYNSKPLAERMKLGGKTLTLRTNADGKATLTLPEFDGIADIHGSYQLVIRFNADKKDRSFNAASLPQLEYYANSGLDP